LRVLAARAKRRATGPTVGRDHLVIMLVAGVIALQASLRTKGREDASVKTQVSKIFTLIWAQILLALVIGTLLSFLPSENAGYRSAFHHIGIGLLVAAVVTLFWHLREFADFFEKFAKSVLLDDAYLARLNIDTLKKLRKQAGHEILRSLVDNLENYKRDDLADWIDTILYDRLLPGGTTSSGLYRENYTDNIVIETKTLQDALLEVGEDSGKYPDDALSSTVHKITTTTRYKIIAPSVSANPDYELRFSANLADMPHFPCEKRIRYRVGHSEPDSHEVHLEIKKRKLGGMSVKANALFLKFVKGECAVWSEMVEFRSPDAEALVLNTMALLTRGLEVDLFQTGTGPELAFDGSIVAAYADNPTLGLHSIRLKFDGWLFESQGYCIWWWKR
jgi:hypothetical protein